VAAGFPATGVYNAIRILSTTNRCIFTRKFDVVRNIFLFRRDGGTDPTAQDECYPIVCFIESIVPGTIPPVFPRPIDVSVALTTSFTEVNEIVFDPGRPPIIIKYNWTSTIEYLNSSNRVSVTPASGGIRWIDVNSDFSDPATFGGLAPEDTALLLVPFNDTNI
jgi:hypothetical protein